MRRPRGILVTVLVAVTVIPLALIMWAAATWSEARLEADLIRSSRELNEALLARLRADCAMDLAVEDVGRLQDAVQRLTQAARGVSHCRILTPDGVTLVAWSKNHEPLPAPGQNVPDHLAPDARLTLGLPVIYDDRSVGRIEMGLSLRNAYARFNGRRNDIQDTFILLLVAASSTCLLVALYVRGRLTRLTRRILRQNDALGEAHQNAVLLSHRAEAANIAKSAFLANMSHELRTPLTGILGHVDLLGDAVGDDPRLREHIRTIHESGTILTSLLNDILDVSKIEAGNMNVEAISCDPFAILEDVKALMNPRAREKELQLEVRIGTPLPSAMISDPLRLRQILINLVGNAIKFTTKGRIGIEVHSVDLPSGRMLQVDVIDTGLGMSEEERAKLFRPFTQGDDSTCRRFGGTGLGLTISRALAELLGGTLVIQETAPGQGSRFRLRVALVPDVEAEWTEQAPERKALPRSRAAALPQNSQILAGKRVLLAEDSVVNQRLIRLVLEKWGLVVDSVDNGREALGSIAEAEESGTPYDLVLMDMQMPVMDGYTATRTLRQQSYEAPIIALTANAMSGDRERCLEAGCSDFEAKPIDRHSLLATLERWMKSITESPTAPS